MTAQELKPETEAKKIVLISDVDDTLKDTHTRSFLGMINRGVRARNAFAGMSELYLRFRAHELTHSPKEWQRSIWSRGLSGGDNRLIVYVTAALGRIHLFPNLFLVYSKFPVGEFIGRSGVGRRHFKLIQIADQIENWDDRLIILIGDNGEYDPEVFSNLKAAYPDRKIISFVHMVYPISVSDEHHVFYTAADLALWFLEYGWISQDDAEAVISKVSKKIETQVTRVFPNWVKVHDVNQNWPNLENLPLSDTAKNCLSKIKRLANARSLNGK